jgi:FKBP-type peptidyl-prolyl cis-trans isomerase FkpA
MRRRLIYTLPDWWSWPVQPWPPLFRPAPRLTLRAGCAPGLSIAIIAGVAKSLRLLVSAALVVAIASLDTALGQAHHIPPLPDTAAAPVKLASGVTYVDLAVGSGVTATRGRTVRILFTGWVNRNELMFDFRDNPADPLAFRIGQGGVPTGLEQGVTGMRVGGKRRLFVPARLGYGHQVRKLIPPGSDLTYDVELVAVARPGV